MTKIVHTSNRPWFVEHRNIEIRQQERAAGTDAPTQWGPRGFPSAGADRIITKSSRTIEKQIGVVALILFILWGSVTSVRAGGFDRAIASALPRVVKLYGLGVGQQAGYGTGVIVSEGGLVLTVFSLLIDARKIRAVASDGTAYEARVIRRDPKRQLALLQLVSPSGSGDHASTSESVGSRPFFDLKKEASLLPGDWVLAAGNAFKVAEGSEPVSIAHGVFSARIRLDARRRLKDYPYHGEVLVIDAITSNPGAPGSALVNLDGELVGMIGRVVVSNLTHTHLNYAVPRDVLDEFFLEATVPLKPSDNFSVPLRQVGMTRGSGEKPVDLGIRVSRVGYRTVLPFVEQVRTGSPADKAGLRKDDLILSVNGRSVANASAYEERVKILSPDESVNLVIRRGRKILSVRVENENTSDSQMPTSERP